MMNSAHKESIFYASNYEKIYFLCIFSTMCHFRPFQVNFLIFRPFDLWGTIEKIRRTKHMNFFLLKWRKNVTQHNETTQYSPATLWMVVIRPNVCIIPYVKLIRIWNLKWAGDFRPMPPFLDPKSALNIALYPIICVFFSL